MERKILLVFVWLASLFAQPPQPQRPVLRTVADINADRTEIQVKPDAGEVRALHLSAQTVLQRIAPREKDLKNAQPLSVTEIQTGDRVLITPQADDPAIARRLVLMAAGDITERNEADRLDWEKRGNAGIVVAISGNQIKVRRRSPQDGAEATVELSEGTSIRRYAPDSIAFADAQPSSVAELRAGDQLRARGTKSEDGLKVEATEVVFGTFTTRAGAIKQINPETREIIISELNTNKQMTITLKPNSQIKRMASFPGMPGAVPGGAMRAGPMRGAGRPSGEPLDISQLVERTPAASLTDLKPGETIIVSSTKGVREDSVTAILLLGNADMLIRMASMQAGGGSGGPSTARGGPGMGGPSIGIGLGGLDLSGITP